MEYKLKKEAATKDNPKWENMIKRRNPIYTKEHDIRAEFERDCNRIIHSQAYRRLKHKTQVFFSPKNDHICTRIEHVNHVESISYTIAKNLGLNTELTRAIAISHDLGHSPFGHVGEKYLSELSKKEIQETFWHEKNGLNMVDHLELLEDDKLCLQNMNLTYAVRDGIISHCGEIDENSLKPRKEDINLNQYLKPNQYAPYTWEGCVVKLSDKISYIGRDIEDALQLGILEKDQLQELYKILGQTKEKEVNNTIIISSLVADVCENSNLEEGLKLSEEKFTMLNQIKKFNYENIYLTPKLRLSYPYFEIIINQIYGILKQGYDGTKTKERLIKMKKQYKNVINSFLDWISLYWDIETLRDQKLKNEIVYHMENETEYKKAIIDYISGMTDNYAIETYMDIISF